MSRSVGKLCGTLLLASSSLAMAQQYSIITAAGGAPPPTPAAPLSTSIGRPSRVMVDGSGNVYFSAANTVFKIVGGNLTVVAGNSRAGYSGDGGPALQAQLNAPQGLALDATGNLYIADSKNNRVRMVNPQGVIFTFAGTGATSPGGANTFNDGGLAINALMRLPSGVAVDNKGNVYIADTGDNIIREVTTNGIIQTVAGDSYPSFFGDLGPAVNAELHSPTDVTVDSSQNLYIADSANGVIRLVTASTGIINTLVGNATIGDTGDTGPATSASLYAPYAVVLDTAGNLYLAENGDGKIRKVSTTQIITTVVGNGTQGFAGDNGPATTAELNFPTGLALDSSGNMYIADSQNNRIRKVAGGTIGTIAGNGNLSYSGDGGQATSAQLNTPQAVAGDSSGNFYIADTFNNAVRKVSSTGVITTLAGTGIAGYGGDGGAASSAQLNGPQGVAVDSSGNVYVSDTQNARVRKISGGTITTVAGTGTPGFGGDGGPATAAQLNLPIGLVVDSAGNLYISDYSNDRIREVSGGTITTIAGNGITGYSGDGGPASSAQINLPLGVAVDSNHNVYIADTGNNVVRKISGGSISTIAGTGLPGFSGDNGLATAALVGNPSGIAVDSSGSVYISDGSSRIRKIYASGYITTIGGNGNHGYSGDGGSAPFGTMNNPLGLGILPNGNVLVADSGNNAVRELTFGGYELSIAAAANAAAELAGAVSPGEVVVFYGSGLGPASLVVNTPNSSGAYGTTLAGTTVYFGNYLAPIIYTEANAVAVVVPLEVSGSVQVLVQYNGQFSAIFPVSVAQSTPGIYTSNLSGTGLAAAINIHSGTTSYNSAANPANAGDYVEFFLTGAGPTSPAGADGIPYTSAANCTLSISVTVGGKSVSPQYCGAVPGIIPGLTQVNVQIPTGLTAGLVPVSMTIGNVATQSGVTIAVSGK